MITIHTDGGARGNPGPAAIGIVVEYTNHNKNLYGEYIGIATNNVAEYKAVLVALKKLLESHKEGDREEVSFFLDSQLVQRQLTGVYKIKDPTLLVIAGEIKRKEQEWGRQILYTHIPREKNKDADLLVNQTLDRQRVA